MKKAIIDIDGVLNYYPSTYIDFCNDNLGTDYKTLEEIKSSISYSLYKKLKNEYRQSDYKHKATVRYYAKELIDYLHENDYLVFIITARQLFSNNQLEKTILWLKNNNLNYDYIYCSIKKDFTIIEKFGHVDVVVEDNIDNLEKIYNINGDANYYNVVNDENRSKQFIYGLKVNYLQEIVYDLERTKNEH